MKKEQFLEQMLSVMERKKHWAWPEFTEGRVPKDKLHVHFEQEYDVYVRDFPVMVGWAYVQCPIAEVRRDLAENLFEEETGGVAAGRPHPELFLDYPKGLGMDLRRFEQVKRLPEAQAYRSVLDRCTQERGWEVATAVTTIFIEGTEYERGEVDEKSAKRPVTPLSEHPLVKHYGLPLENLSLTKAHRLVEGEHRSAAWDMMLDFVDESARQSVIESMKDALGAWLRYRDAVAAQMGLVRDA